METTKENMFIFRTPLLRLSDLLSNEDDLLNAFKNPTIRDAVFIASEDLYNQLIKLEINSDLDPKKKEKAIINFHKYYSRLCTRPTPFGLFSGINIGSFDQVTSIKMDDKIIPTVRLDMDLMCEIYESVIQEKKLRESLIFYPNNTLYKIFNQWRYVEYQTNYDSVHFHNLVAVENNRILAKILQKAKTGASFEKLQKLTSDFGYNEKEATEYIHSLVDSQVLIPNIYPNLTGSSFQLRFFNHILELGYKKYEKIHSIVNTYSSLNKPISKIVSEVSESLQEFNIFKKSSNIVQADLPKSAIECTIDDQIKAKVKEIMQLLSSIMIKQYEPNHLNDFKAAFYERYEDKFVPLTTALDPDLGIGFKNAISKTKAQFNYSESDRKIHSYKLDILLKSIASGNKPYEINREEIESLAQKEKRNQPCSFAVMANLYLDKTGKTAIRFKNGGGSSALNLLGRFAYLNSDIEMVCKDIASQEESYYKNKILAEIVHFPQGRIGNVLLRPHFYSYEIPYLGMSTLPGRYQITVDDLLVAVRNNKIVLYSKRLKKEILPRLSTAHNFRFDSLPIYQFLGELQSQDEILGCYWSWDELSQQSFLPRITYKDVILSPARWNINTDTFQSKEANTLINQLKNKGIPTIFLVCQGDNEMYIDVENELGRKTFLNLCKKTPLLVLEESLFNNDNTPDGYTNEICIPFVQNFNQLEQPPTVSPFSGSSIKPSLTPFSNCIYLKLYIGTKWAEKLLTDIISKLVKELRKKEIINKWFFIRYNDPQAHIRLRFFIKDGSHGTSIDIIGKWLKNYIHHELIWDIQLGTYQRELERYGYSTMEDCEDYFCNDSELVLKLLPHFKKLKDADKIALVIFYMNTLFKQFSLSDLSIVSLCKSQLDAFSREFNLEDNKQFRMRLSSEYREQSNILKDIFSSGISLSAELNMCRILIERSFYKSKKNIHSITNKIIGNSNAERKIISSLIHMFINRLFDYDQRYKELVIYYMISKYYDSYKARKQHAEE